VPVDGWLEGALTHLSASGLRLLRVCPEAWRRRYILGQKERPGEALVMGSAVHDALAFTHRQKIETHQDLPVPEVVEFFNDLAWPKAVEDDGGEGEIRWDGKPDSVRADGARVTGAYHSIVSPRIQPLRVEERFEFAIPGVPVPIVGYIDVEEQHDNIDLKTGKAVQKKPDANWRLQGSIYTLYNSKPTHFHSASRAKVPSIATPLEHEAMMVTTGIVQREAIENVIRAHAADVERYFDRYGPEETWPLNGLVQDYKGGPACDYCGFRKDCPAWAHERTLA